MPQDPHDLRLDTPKKRNQCNMVTNAWRAGRPGYDLVHPMTHPTHAVWISCWQSLLLAATSVADNPKSSFSPRLRRSCCCYCFLSPYVHHPHHLLFALLSSDTGTSVLLGLMSSDLLSAAAVDTASAPLLTKPAHIEQHSTPGSHHHQCNE